MKRRSILFVCLGNICRSPTAEAVFRAKAQRAGLASRLVIDSAGTGSWHVGNPPDWRASAHAAKRGYDLSSLRARQIVREDFARFDRIFAMDHANLADLERLRQGAGAGHLGLFLDLVPRLRGRDVPDPYDGGEDGFEKVLDLVEEASAALVTQLAQDDG
ncbi:MAG: low molecular weight phosphotyrosine protein phosphatase [Burkholderiales bacterium]|jgi:protein-tyrosine phosphatase|nr:low molecular weight phosphotyrosine protein phosphatase [Burkholderiales bacterium]